MTLESARAWLSVHAPDLPIIEVEASTATVDQAADALGVEPGRIAKTLVIRVLGEVFLVVARGDARLDNAKSKVAFGGRPRMLGSEETLAVTGHPVWRRLPVRTRDCTSCLLRRIASAIRHSLSGGRFAQQLGRGDA
jgi:prolyl-tRNA editing enzyme YbaK/EbsC (Cys-tRNA(Pro) deacylase)